MPTNIQEEGPQLPEGAIRVRFSVDDSIKEVYAYPGMPRDGNPNIPTLYELMTDDLDLWASSSESEDEVGDGWSTFISKRKKYKNKRYVSPTSPKTHSQRPQKGIGPSKQVLP